tara:strand:- start:4569 stop:4733 length:165 start_codon:yes stop_codon:yes gene_type:complete
MGYFDEINLSDKRFSYETYDQYKERIKKNKIKIKMHLKGELIWESNKMGTYKRK